MVRSGIDLVNKEVAKKIDFKFSRRFEELVKEQVSWAVLARPEKVEEFFTSMVMRTFLGNMRYEEAGDRKYIPTDPYYNSRGYTFCDWSPYVWHTGLKNKIKAFMSGPFKGNREFLPDICNYAMFCYILLENKEINGGRYSYQPIYNRFIDRYWDYLNSPNEDTLVVIGATALGEYVYPLHPDTHYTEMDQGKHGRDASGSVRPLLDRWR